MRKTCCLSFFMNKRKKLSSANWLLTCRWLALKIFTKLWKFSQSTFLQKFFQNDFFDSSFYVESSVTILIKVAGKFSFSFFTRKSRQIFRPCYTSLQANSSVLLQGRLFRENEATKGKTCRFFLNILFLILWENSQTIHVFCFYQETEVMSTGSFNFTEFHPTHWRCRQVNSRSNRVKGFNILFSSKERLVTLCLWQLRCRSFSIFSWKTWNIRYQDASKFFPQQST